jgi:hypothetical protein
VFLTPSSTILSKESGTFNSIGDMLLVPDAPPPIIEFIMSKQCCIMS